MTSDRFFAVLLAVVTTAPPRLCALPHCFSLTISAGRLGEFAGVLTALTFTAVIFLAGRDRKDIEDTLIMFLTAFVSLAVATYLFTGAAAEEHQSYRAAFESFCASMALSIALQLLFLGIAQLMRDHEFPTVAKFAARVGKWAVGLIVFLFMSLTAINGVGLFWSPSKALQSPVAIGCAVFFVTLILWLVALYMLSRFRNWSGGGWPGVTRWAGFSLVIIGIVSVLTAVWGERSTDAPMPAAGYLALMALLLLSTLGYFTQLTDIEQNPTSAVASQANADGPPTAIS